MSHVHSSHILPKAMRAASLNLQSALLMLSLTKGRTNGTMSSSQHVARSMRHTPAALLGFQSSSSSYSSYKVNQSIKKTSNIREYSLTTTCYFSDQTTLLFLWQEKCKSAKLYSNALHIFYKCVLGYFAYLTGFYFDVMEIQLYCCKDNHTARDKLFSFGFHNTFKSKDCLKNKL